MNVLVVGSGGREHAIAWKLAQSPRITKLYCASGNAGTAAVAENVPINDNNELADWALENQIALTVVGPEAPLADGIVDLFTEKGLRIFGPTKAAAQLESSKSFAKQVMLDCGVPTAAGKVFKDYDEACAYVKECGAPIVVKADGLAAGKGVTVAQTEADALAALEDCFVSKKFGNSGDTVVVEQCINGPESSVMAFIQGNAIRPFVISQDFKRLSDGDQGPNTGGMGAVSPSPVLEDSTAEGFVDSVFRPVVEELARQGISFCGFLYAGIIIDAESGEASVLEFNCRLGDPETQVLMMRLDSDLLEVLDAAVDGKLDSVELQWSPRAAACVVASSRGYPDAVDDGKPIAGLFSGRENLTVFQAGTKLVSGDSGEQEIITKGGRILVVAATGDDREQALDAAYAGLKEISFDGMHFRTDIGRTS